MQDNIGWDQFVRGRIAIEWGHTINNHLQSINNDIYTAEKWATELIKINFKHVLLLWETRNKEEHGQSVEEIEIKKTQRLLQEVRYILECSKKWRINDQRYLPESIDELEEKSSRQLELWLIHARILNKVYKCELISEDKRCDASCI